MAHHSTCIALAALASLTSPGLRAQDAATQTVNVTGTGSRSSVSVSGFGDVPLYRAPFSATVISSGQLADAGLNGLADLTHLDAATTDAYNAPGYIGQLAVRGYTLDNRSNYRRDGLPINAETAIAQGNKAALEILKGTSGLQAGVSAPGGLVNLVVKRPVDHLRSFNLGHAQDGSYSASADLSQRLGDDKALGWRVNAGYTRLDPPTRASRGHSQLLAGAADLRLANGGLLQAEFESSQQSQPSTPGFSLLGNRLPSAGSIDPRINLNNQAWSLPVVLGGQTASLRYSQALSATLDLQAQWIRQRLTSQDRIAFPFGCTAEANFDRYCSDGSFDLYDYRSENERRLSDALDLSLSGQAQLAGMAHRYSAGLLVTRFSARFQRNAYNFVGIGRIDGLSVLPSDPTLNFESSNADQRSSEFRLQDRVALNPQTSLWAGLRHTRLRRDSVLTDGSQATRTDQAFTTPWLALMRALNPQQQVYLSWGQGIESDVVPNRPQFAHPGQVLPALKSAQVELGLKHHSQDWDGAIAAFDIRRPQASDIGACDGSAGSCRHVLDGNARHRGVEAEGQWPLGALTLRASAMLLRARREGSNDPAANGLRPTNVPDHSLKLQAAYAVAGWPGLALLGFVSHEGQRMVLPDNSVATPGWTRLDLGARWSLKRDGLGLVWRAGIDNLANTRAWKEAPFQFGHAYLYPLQPRTLHASVQVDY